MPLVKAKCENCGANLDVDNTQKTAICPFCGTKYIVQDAIKQYISQSGTAMNSAADKISAAETFIKLKKYSEAMDLFYEASKLTPQNPRIWWGIVRAQTQEFTIQDPNSLNLNIIHDTYLTAVQVADEKTKKQIASVFEPYYSRLTKQAQQEATNKKVRIAQLEKEYGEIEKQIGKLKKASTRYKTKREHSEKSRQDSIIFFRSLEGSISSLLGAGAIICIVIGVVRYLKTGIIPVNFAIYALLLFGIVILIRILSSRKYFKKKPLSYAEKSVNKELWDLIAKQSRISDEINKLKR